MRIGIISDSHGSLYYFQKALDLMGPCDYIIHCGDVLPISGITIKGGYDPEALAKLIESMDNIYFAEGNGDFYSKTLLPNTSFHKDLTLKLGGYSFFVTHGHLSSRMSMLMKAQEAGVHILCYGHSHIKELDYYDHILLLNPGSISLPRDGSRSFALLEDDTVSIWDLDNENIIASMELKNSI